MPSHRQLQFPRQKIADSKKSEKWAIQNIEAAEDLALFRDDRIRQSFLNKIANYNLYNDVLDTEDIEKVCNPMGIAGAEFPAKMQNYPIANPKIDLLVGEEAKRRFDWKVTVTNDDAISEKEKSKKQELMQFMTAKIQATVTDEESLKKELEALNKYLTYEWQDLRERRATHILQYLYKHLKLDDLFNRGFEDLLISSEEIYCADIVGGEPILRKVNPLNLHTIRSGESPYIDDADIIIEDGYHSPGQVMDMYYDHLKPEHVDRIEQGLLYTGQDDFISIGEREQSLVMEGLIDVHETRNRSFGEAYDSEGNVRVVRVVWRSLRKIGKLKYYDEQGDPQDTVVDENYKINKDLGEEIEWLWIGEWWEGTRIGGGTTGGGTASNTGIYVKIQPRPIQFRGLENLSKCKSGYVGTAFNTNDSRAKSLMDRMKPYQYLYNVFMYRTELAFAKTKGRIGKLDMSRIPDDWDMDKWMYYAEVMGWAVEDPFKEATKGVATGKLSGQMNQSSPVIDLEMGNYIQTHIMMLQYLEQQIGEIAGVSKQRQGQVENRELVGNVERAVTQSSHITEKWFKVHDAIKLRALSALLETAKYAWRENNKKVQYVLDDMSISMLNIEGPLFNEAEYGLIASNASNDAEVMAAMKQLAHAGIQNDKINFSQLLDIYMTPSMASMRRKIEASEMDKMQRDQQQSEQAERMQTQSLQEAARAQDVAREHEMAKIDKEYDRKIELEQIKQMASFQGKHIDADRDGVIDAVEVEKEKLRIQQETSENEKTRSHESLENEKDRTSKEKIAKENAKNKQKAIKN